MDYRTDAPPLLRDFLVYHETIQGHSHQTVDEYFLDLRSFFRFLKQDKRLVPPDTPFDSISIDDVDLALVRDVTLTDIYAYMDYLARSRGLNSASRARKVAAIRSFYKYLTAKAKVLPVNPVQDLDSPRLKKKLAEIPGFGRKRSAPGLGRRKKCQSGLLHSDLVSELRPANLRIGWAEQNRCSGRSAPCIGKRQQRTNPLFK